MPVPDFVLALRRHVGHAPLWLIGVTAVVTRESDAGTEVLLVQRSDNGAWSPVTGIVDPGEEPWAAAEREVLEEACVRARVEALAQVSVTDVITHANGDVAQYLDHTFRCAWVAGEPAVGDDESLAARWFALDALPPMQDDVRERIGAAVGHEGTTLLGRRA